MSYGSKVPSSSDQLLPGTDHSPGYGASGPASGRPSPGSSYGVQTEDSSNFGTRHSYGSRVSPELTSTSSAPSVSGGYKERVVTVARCALTACLASLLAGMTGGFSSPALQDLGDADFSSPAQLFSNTTVLHGVFAVSFSNYYGEYGFCGKSLDYMVWGGHPYNQDTLCNQDIHWYDPMQSGHFV